MYGCKKLLETAGVGNEENFNRWVDKLMALPASDDAEQEKAVFGAFCIRGGDSCAAIRTAVRKTG